MRFTFLSFFFLFVSSQEDNDSSPSPKPKPKPSPQTPTPLPTFAPTSLPTSAPTEFNYCFHWGFSDFETCGTYGFDEDSFCLDDIEGSTHCFQNALCNNLPPCSTSADCPTNYLCTAVCNSTLCSPLCGSIDGPIDPYFANAPYYPTTASRCFDQSDTPLNDGILKYSESMEGTALGYGLKSQQQLEEQSFILTHLNVVVFVALTIVVVIGTATIILSSRLSSSQESPQQASFQEVSTMDSVDRTTFVNNLKPKDVELEPVSQLPSKKDISQIQL